MLEITKTVTLFISIAMLVCFGQEQRPEPQPRSLKQKSVLDYGAQPATLLHNCNIMSLSSTVWCANADFNSGDIGKVIAVDGAGAGGGDLGSTIVNVTSPTSVELAAPAQVTVNQSPAWYGKDNTSAINQALSEISPSDTLVIPGANSTYCVGGNIVIANSNVYLQGPGGLRICNLFTNALAPRTVPALLNIYGSASSNITIQGLSLYGLKQDSNCPNEPKAITAYNATRVIIQDNYVTNFGHESIWPAGNANTNTSWTVRGNMFEGNGLLAAGHNPGCAIQNNFSNSVVSFNNLNGNMAAVCNSGSNNRIESNVITNQFREAPQPFLAGITSGGDGPISGTLIANNRIDVTVGPVVSSKLLINNAADSSGIIITGNALHLVITPTSEVVRYPRVINLVGGTLNKAGPTGCTVAKNTITIDMGGENAAAVTPQGIAGYGTLECRLSENIIEIVNENPKANANALGFNTTGPGDLTKVVFERNQIHGLTRVGPGHRYSFYLPRGPGNTNYSIGGDQTTGGYLRLLDDFVTTSIYDNMPLYLGND